MNITKACSLLILSTYLSACAANYSGTNITTHSRFKIAYKLTEKEQLAQALTQWQILQLRFPDNTLISRHIRRIERQIEQQKMSLWSALDQAKGNNTSLNQEQDKKLLLKILALDPNDAKAQMSLRELSWQSELKKANKKTRVIKKLFKENDEKAKVEIAIASLSSKIETAILANDFPQVLVLVEQLAKASPKNKDLNSHRFTAFSGLAENSLKNGNKNDALVYLNKAKENAPTEEKQRLNTKIVELKRRESNRLSAAAQKVFMQDITSAIGLLKEAVALDKTNAKAQQLLSRALKIEQNLKRIKNQR